MQRTIFIEDVDVLRFNDDCHRRSHKPPATDFIIITRLLAEIWRTKKHAHKQSPIDSALRLRNRLSSHPSA